jgi:hypothetical protein
MVNSSRYMVPSNHVACLSNLLLFRLGLLSVKILFEAINTRSYGCHCPARAARPETTTDRIDLERVLMCSDPIEDLCSSQQDNHETDIHN